MLDVKATEDLWKKLIELWDNQTVLIVEHKVKHIYVDRVLLMNYEGQIIADDTPDHILNHYEHLLTEYGVWHPKAWDNAPRPCATCSMSIKRYLNLNMAQSFVVRKHFSVDEFKFGAGEWLTITGKMVQVKLHY